MHCERMKDWVDFLLEGLSNETFAHNKQLAAGKKPGEVLCQNTRGNRMMDISYWFRPALADAGIEDYRWQDHRHTARGRWVMDGAPLAAVALYAGHSTMQMAMRYSHLVPGAGQAASSVMDTFYEKASLYRSGIESANRTATGTPKDSGGGG